LLHVIRIVQAPVIVLWHHCLPACIEALYKKLPFSSILGTSHSITVMKWGSRTVELYSVV